jgi:hypothetical protein
MRAFLVFLLLLSLKALTRLCYRFDLGWVGAEPPRPWSGYRVAAILNHTSLFDVLWVAAPPASLLWLIAHHGVIPVADITLQRPWAGRFFGFLGRHVVALSRERDHTWSEVMGCIDDPEALVVLLPEGRMMRRDGLDKHGKPMTVRSGIADILEAIPDGRMLLAYSAGVHHVQAPGDRLPRLFKTLRMRFECIDIPSYRQALVAGAGERGFRRAVVKDLEDRRDRYCWPDPRLRPGPRPADLPEADRHPREAPEAAGAGR